MPYTPKVLVIDDLPETGRMIAKYLSRSGISLLIARSGEEGLDIVRTETIDVILLDIDLGAHKDEGFDVLAALKAERSLSHIPVVMLSVFDQPETKVRAFELGAEDYISKPFEPIVLRARIQAVLRGVQSLRALKRNREKYHSLFQNSLVGIFRTSLKDGRLLTCNAKALELLGLGPEHVKAVRLLDFYARPTDRKALMNALMTNGYIKDFELEMRRLDGSPVWISLSARLYAAEGYMEGVATGITEQVEARLKIRDKEEQFRATFNQAAVGIMHIDPDLQLLRVNHRLCDILGYTAEELLAMNIADFMHPDDAAENDYCVQRLLLHELENCSLERRYKCRKGSYVWVQSTVSLVCDDDTGEAKYFIVVVEDIEKRKYAEEMLRQILEVVSPKIGDSFFTSLVTHLASALEADHAYIGEYIEAEDALLVRASSFQRDIPTNHLFPIADSPAEEVLKKGLVCYERGIRDKFPRAMSLDGLEVNGYIGTALYDAHGNPLGLIAVFSSEPISATADKAALLKVFAARAASELERKRSVMALKESEANLMALFDNALQSFLLIGSEGKIRAMNKTAAVTNIKVWGCEVSEGDAFPSFVRPENLANFTNHFAFALSGRAIEMEWKVERPDESCYWFEFSFTPVFIDGLVTGVCLSMLDITHRRLAVEQLAKSEERFRTLIEKSTDIITILNEEAVIQYESPSVEAILGYKVHELEGCDIFEFVHPEDTGPLYDLFAASLGVPGTVVTTVFRFLHNDGSWHYMETTTTNMLFDPNLRGLILNSHDVTERMMFENERTILLSELETKNDELQQAIVVLQETQAQLVQSERTSAIGNLVAGVMHEINNPNAAIYGAIQDALQTASSTREYFFSLLGEEDRTSNEAIEMATMLKNLERTLEIASDGAERIRAIVATLRSFTKHQEAEQQTADLAEQVASTVTLFRYQFKNVEVRTHFPADEMLLISGNLGEINQVLLNLLVNAAQAGATAVDITGQRNNIGELLVSIADNGRGMDETTRLKIFEPFFTTRGVGNTGLGLNITKKIMQKHNANIVVDSAPNSGTTFTLVFPPEKQEAERSAVAV